MKKNIFSDNGSGKGTKGFYAALGISALMIGSACFFAYNQGEKLIKDNELTAEQSSVSEEAVDRKYTDIPKTVTTAAETKSSAVMTTVVRITTAAPIPAADIVVDEPPVEAAASNKDTPSETAEQKLENVSAPLADMSEIINPFSGTELVKNETTGSWQTHNGTDIAAETGTEVYAVSPGEVTAVNDDPLWGTTVVIDHHNGYITKYCGLAKELSVQKGDVLASGNVIGVTGDTADIESALAPHLHIEIMHNGNYIDPMVVFG